jgi:hypothetical protein
MVSLEPGAVDEDSVVEVLRVRSAAGIVLARRGTSGLVGAVRIVLALVPAVLERLEVTFGDGVGREQEIPDIISVFMGVTFIAALMALRVSISTVQKHNVC